MSRTFSAHFKSLYNFSIEAFTYLSSDRVVLIDQAQLTFNDVSLWNHIKRVLVGEMPGTPITIPSTSTFGLSGTLSKPGLHVSRAELEEMDRNTKWVSTWDLLWILCSGHIGIARAMLSYRGIPTACGFQDLIHGKKLTDESATKMRETMDEVASGKIVHFTSVNSEAVDLSTRFGFLYVDQFDHLQVSSNMHLKTWLYTNRSDPADTMVLDPLHDDFVVGCVKRMRASTLEQLDSVAQVRQLQLELYRVVSSCLPRSVLITPAWRTDDGHGFDGLVIQGLNSLWFWELVSGEDAVANATSLGRGRTQSYSFALRAHWLCSRPELSRVIRQFDHQSADHTRRLDPLVEVDFSR